MGFRILPMQAERHRQAMLGLWAEKFEGRPEGTGHLAARWDWFYGRGARTFVAINDETDAVVGCTSVFPRETWVAGAPLRAGVMCDFIVTKGQRFAGAALGIQRAMVQGAAENGFACLYGYPNQAALAIFKRIGFQIVGQTREWVKPLRSEYFLREHMKHALLLGAASRACDLVLLLADQPLLRIRALGFRVQVIDQPDASFDDLWRRADKAGVMGVKDRDYLTWRYSEMPSREKHFFCLYERDRLVAFAVYALTERKAMLRDWLCAGPEFLDPLLVKLADHLRGQGAEAVIFNYVGPASLGESLKPLLFVARPRERSLVLHIGDGVGPAQRAALQDCNQWTMCDGELDI